MTEGRRLLHVAPFPPTRVDSGGHVRLGATARWLDTAGWDVRGVYADDPALAPPVRRPGPVGGRARRAWQLAALGLGRAATPFFDPCTPALQAAVDAEAAHASVALVELGQVAPCRPTGVPAVLVLYDLTGRKLRGRARLRSTATGARARADVARLALEAAAVERRELAAASAYDAVVVVSAADRAALAEDLRAAGLPVPPIAVSPNGVDVAAFAAVPPVARAGTVAFVGGLDHPPNLDAVRCLQDLALRAELVLAGRHTEGWPGGLGVVDDIRDVYARATVTVAPIRWGSGTRLKVVESLAAGRPVVAFPEAVEGLEGLVASGAVLVAETTTGLAAAVDALAGDVDRARALGEVGRRAVADLDWSRTLVPLGEALAGVGAACR